MTDRGADGARLRCDMLVPCHAGDDTQDSRRDKVKNARKRQAVAVASRT
jgi:hypothetical protein